MILEVGIDRRNVETKQRHGGAGVMVDTRDQIVSLLSYSVQLWNKVAYFFFAGTRVSTFLIGELGESQKVVVLPESSTLRLGSSSSFQPGATGAALLLLSGRGIDSQPGRFSMPHSSSWLSSGRARGLRRPPLVYNASQSGQVLRPYPLHTKHLQMKCLFFRPSISFTIGFKTLGMLMCPIPAQKMHCCFDRPRPPQVQQGRGRNSHPGFPKSDPGYSFWNRTRFLFGFPSSRSSLCFHQAKTGKPTLTSCIAIVFSPSETFRHFLHFPTGPYLHAQSLFRTFRTS